MKLFHFASLKLPQQIANAFFILTPAQVAKVMTTPLGPSPTIHTSA